MKTKRFYDQLSPYYHLIYPDWQKSINRQAQTLRKVIRSSNPQAHDLLDLSCGIGTQSLGLAKLGYSVTGNDISSSSIQRAKAEAKKRKLKIKFSTSDMTTASKPHKGKFDVAISCDNSVPHLLTDRQILKAFKEAYKCLRSGGLYLISVRDYKKEERGQGKFKPYSIQKIKGTTYTLFQTWDFTGDHYDLSFFVVEEKKDAKPKVIVSKSKYYAVGLNKLTKLMKEAGFKKITRVKSDFYQPIITGLKP